MEEKIPTHKGLCEELEKSIYGCIKLDFSAKGIVDTILPIIAKYVWYYQISDELAKEYKLTNYTSSFNQGILTVMRLLTTHPR